MDEMNFPEGLYWVLDEDNIPRPARDMEEVYSYMGDSGKKRRVAWTIVGDFEVSTVFLVIAHGYRYMIEPNAMPDLFETMVFGGEKEYQWRYTSYEKALEGHERVVQCLKDRGPCELEEI